MAVLLAVFIPVLMLGVVLALGRYEELVLPGTAPPPDGPDPGPGPDASASSSGEADSGSGIEKRGRAHSV
ncbi:hypothetical protein [Streptomyces sp. DH41]|uniref:hypothetical protein n=1 Tax=Streptomyces sp. DH41 TaxID=3040125 RepID=UPI0024419759|nr:hypothetical protein [Streptomyces sp. DH41]MDG9723436.1 hypothetical protein [Streptomyces sp. DH41]